MTIVMEEDGFNSSLSSLSSLSSQSNYQTLTVNGNNSNRTTIFQGQQQQQQQSNSSPPSSIGDNPNGPFAIFLFRSNSGLELFEERKIFLDKPCKIGRSVAKIKPEPSNAIFDCKVLSRNHALLWHENNKFYIQDTKSSNGTFLNGNRLGKSNEDSQPFDLTSGDIIQFGVDVTENTKKVTHGCITVEIKLFHKPGVEASVSKPNQSVQSNKIDVQTQELYQLALFLQEAAMREEVLHQKINSLQAFIDQARETSENGWLTLIDEDRLLSRIDFLEKQSNLNNKNPNEESLRNTINNLNNEKFNIESTAKLAIQKMIEEKNETLQKYDELKTYSSLRDEECNQLQRVLDESKTSLVELAGKYQDLLNETSELQKELTDSRAQQQESVSQVDAEKSRYEALVEESANVERTLNAKIESLIAEKDFTSKRLEGILNKIEKNNIVLNNEINCQEKQEEDQVLDLEPALIIKQEKQNGFTGQNGIDSHLNGEKLMNGAVVEENEKSEAKKEDLNEYHQQELELQKIINENLLKEIDRLKSVMNSDLKEEGSSGSESSSPVKETELTKPLVEKQQNGRKSLDNGINTSDSSANVSNNLVDLKSEFNFIKNKIIQIEIETRDILSNKENQSGIENQFMKNVQSLEESFKRINEIKESIDLRDQANHDLNLTDAQKESEQNLNKFLKLQEQYKDLETNFDGVKCELVNSEESLTKLNNDFKDISLQIKIVSYFSTFPLLILIIAVMISFYSPLATITATGV